jgi:hypothetical protein
VAAERPLGAPEPGPENQLPPCGWCGDPSITEVITVPGRKNRKTAPVCRVHAEKFEREGQITTRLEVETKTQRQQRSAEWRKEHIRY